MAAVCSAQWGDLWPEGLRDQPWSGQESRPGLVGGVINGKLSSGGSFCPLRCGEQPRLGEGGQRGGLGS